MAVAVDSQDLHNFSPTGRSGPGPNHEPREPDGQKTNNSGSPVGRTVVAEMRKMASTEKILIVDDDPDVRSAFKIALTQGGFAVNECADGIEALERTRTATPSLIILDVDMPRLDG